MPPIDSTSVQTSISRVTSESIVKLSVNDRLRRLSKYRIRSTSVEGTAETNGRGAKAEVIRTRLKRKNGTLKRVAVKKLLFSETMDKDKFSREFVHEMELLAKLSHKNIVEFVGFVEDLKHGTAWIILSWEANGNVREFLASGNWEIPERISLIKDMFDGLEYLHTCQPPICHGDLKSLNILVSSSCNAIITDFGSARVLSSEDTQVESQGNLPYMDRPIAEDEEGGYPEVMIVATANQLTLTGPVWTLRWAAPELVKEEERPGLASDIWSAGWVCWEMMTDRVPFEELKRDCAVALKVIQGIVPSTHEDEQLAQVKRLCDLMRDCWKIKPENRLHASQCCRQIKWIPSVPPGGGTSSSPKETSLKLSLQMGAMRYSQARQEKAALLRKQIDSSGGSDASSKEVATALRRLGNVYRVQSKYAEANESYSRARDLYARIGDGQGQADSTLGLGHVFSAQSNYTEAEKSYARAQVIYTRIDSDLGRANTTLGLGEVYRAQSKNTEAEESYKQAQEIYAWIGNDQGRANTMVRLGELYCAQFKYTEAEESYKRAQGIYTRIGSDQGQANAILELGDVYRAQSKYSEAEASYARAKEIYTRIGDGLGQANAQRGLDRLD